jgi:F-type H+-transporting ATPase subunit b|uniref:F0F1 ATP synthase subunit B n=1 Tax=Cephaloticoccus sp. TaxID=1985742 RepID=UPI00404A5468
MSTLYLASVEAAHAASETGIIEKFGLQVNYVVIQAVSFLIVMGVLYRFAIKPTIVTMEERATKIESGLKYAEDMKAKLDATQQESANILKQAQGKAGDIINEARDSAKDFLEKQTQEATQKANDMLVKAQQAIELERRKTIEEARAEIARLVVATTERVLAKNLSDADRATYNESAVRELNVV